MRILLLVSIFLLGTLLPLASPKPCGPLPKTLPPVKLPFGKLPPVTLPGKLPFGKVPPVTLPPVTLPPVTLPGKLPFGKVPPVTLPPVILPPVTLPPVKLPPAKLPKKTLPNIPPKLTCPIEPPKISGCLGGLLSAVPLLGKPALDKCCPYLGGLDPLTVSHCLCSGLKDELPFDTTTILSNLKGLLGGCGLPPVVLPCL